MKIAYLIDYDPNTSSGVIQKILQQSEKWIKSCYNSLKGKQYKNKCLNFYGDGNSSQMICKVFIEISIKNEKSN